LNGFRRVFSLCAGASSESTRLLCHVSRWIQSKCPRKGKEGRREEGKVVNVRVNSICSSYNFCEK
jgi:hypothetical protein